MPKCDRKKSDMTPCVIEDGPVAYAMNSYNDPICVGCGRTPERTGVPCPDNWDELVREYKKHVR
jgi:hypothetical protein